MDTFPLDRMVKKNDDYNSFYECRKNENEVRKLSVGALSRTTSCRMEEKDSAIHKGAAINEHPSREKNIIQSFGNMRYIHNGGNKVLRGGAQNSRNDRNNAMLTSGSELDEEDDQTDDEEDSSCIECVSNDDNSYYSLYEGYKTNYIMESLFDRNSFVYFLVPFNKYSYTNYYTNWNKLSFRMYASLNSVQEKSVRRKRKINYVGRSRSDSNASEVVMLKGTVAALADQARGGGAFQSGVKSGFPAREVRKYHGKAINAEVESPLSGRLPSQSSDHYSDIDDVNFRNPLIKIMNSFLYFLLLSEFFTFNEVIKLMPLCKCSYEIFNRFFYVNVHVNPFRQNVKDIIRFLNENKEYQFYILKGSNCMEDNWDSHLEMKRELLTYESLIGRVHDPEDGPSNGGLTSSTKDSTLNKAEKFRGGNSDGQYGVPPPGDLTTNKEMEECATGNNPMGRKYSTKEGGKRSGDIDQCTSSSSSNTALDKAKESIKNGEKVLHTNNIMNMRYLFSLYEFIRIYLSKENREGVIFCTSDDKFKRSSSRSREVFYDDIFPYGNKISSFEYKIKLKKHVQRRWNLKSNYVHENYFVHKTRGSNGAQGGLLKLIHNKHSQLYPSFSSFLSMDKCGCINLWKVNDVNSLLPTRLLEAQLTWEGKNALFPRDAVNLRDDTFLVADESAIYSFSLEGTNPISAKRIAHLDAQRISEGGKVKNIVMSDKGKCTVGLNEAICYRIDLESGAVESEKKLMEKLKKITCFDYNTNIVMSKKNIIIDDKRMPNYVSYVNYNLIDYDNDKKYFNSENYFQDFSLTGISLTSLNSNNSIFLFDLRYKYPSTCLHYESPITETQSYRENEKMLYLLNLKRNYNSRSYCSNKKYSGFHDNIILNPLVTPKKEVVNKGEDNLVKDKILSDESFIYTIVKEGKDREMEGCNLPTSFLNMWRWCDKRQFKTFFHYHEDITAGKRNYSDMFVSSPSENASSSYVSAECSSASNLGGDFFSSGEASEASSGPYYYRALAFDQIYKFVDTPNHLFLTYEHSNYVHSLLSPSHGLELKTSLKEVPFFMHPTNL
ncbi:conserved Plasmodium protein, unknown function [Plasmodium knowlesi strain H]|uniref:Uncharacterized protein n=3 Tax=Plasmodium knowlesi TaxID=5850 RepID=A0A5K1VIF0_PLAKH|nr:conserved Plasmodium protein, unknown function [Plasmodium knowlesi strain H]OTN66430.1 Uncharacterized protein PKNOH_S09543300 [Plasmodium knowlesi]CAA9989880.1 conserved Plasmodium protein, unknown function [Plasmodium knowlesi strain H]SBO24439.1 conserved Plasmodium protein, unknown function [Plasmodium knowlesi strain H]SBO26566.1 conserved Plasmodium protein, unknown function [Plasmodium knowlesi strain H]VVS79354.1 conserved Plasmodium protein, unknown function [Plasmodium knowlesi s|eukprot:XP_002259896.1 hypothetical protein, conserved in Plasmodium species [Plasmodium knowlesi strain H]